MPAAGEESLIDRFNNGDPSAFRELVETHMRQAYDLAYSFLHDHHDADDVAQEAFVRVYRSLSGFRAESGFSTWLYRIVTNLALDRTRQRQRAAARHVPFHDPVVEGTMNSADETLSSDISKHVERALHTLPTMQRAVVILRHMDGLSTKQVSSILRCSEGTVKTHLHRGLKKMQGMLKHMREEMA
jgi:RNA polymerase sigma-70 factor (ECF subfamily)